MPNSSGTLSGAVAALLGAFADETFVTQTEVARRTGISQSQISKLFRAERAMTIDQFDRICGALGLSPTAVIAEGEAASKRSGANDERSAPPS